VNRQQTTTDHGLAALSPRAPAHNRGGRARRLSYRSHPQSLHLWMPLTGGRTEDGFVAQARLQGVAIAPGTSEAEWQPAVRISVGSTTEEELRTGLGIVSRLLGDPEHLLLAI
jgi:DNA-binding transcriptional MocR family regulator